MAKKDEAKAEGEAAVVETADGPLARPDRRRRQADDQARQEARLRHQGRAERGAAVRGSHLRPDRGHVRDAHRDGHQRRRDRGAERPKRKRRRPTKRRPRAANSSRPPRTTAVATRTSEPADRTDDPVRMYLREMGSVELLSREGEIAIAKRIEAGREAMIAGLCESPLTFQAIIIWRDELNEARSCCATSSTSKRPMPARTARSRRRSTRPRRRRRGAPQSATRDRVAPATAPHDAAGTASTAKPRRPRTASTTRTISRIRCRSRRWRPSSSRRCSRPSTASPTPTRSCAGCRTRRSRTSSKNEALTPAQERKYKALKNDIVADVKSLSLNQNRIEALVEQLYDINRRLIGLEAG